MSTDTEKTPRWILYKRLKRSEKMAVAEQRRLLRYLENNFRIVCTILM